MAPISQSYITFGDYLHAMTEQAHGILMQDHSTLGLQVDNGQMRMGFRCIDL